MVDVVLVDVLVLELVVVLVLVLVLAVASSLSWTWGAERTSTRIASGITAEPGVVVVGSAGAEMSSGLPGS